MTKKILLFILFFSFKHLYGQIKIAGNVIEKIHSNEFPLIGASVYFIPGNQGVFTDTLGGFALNLPDGFPAKLVISFPGYTNDTLEINSAETVRVLLKKSVNLKEVEVTAKKEALAVSTINPMNSIKITQVELLKAACCNLSEAFETNPSVNVAYKDAVTGVKEIQLLGLGGIYVQLQSENIPDMHGLAGIYGLTFIPGPWIESIQLTKGSGSVINGYESTTGQINVEYKKSMDMEQPRFFLNLFGDERGGMEANIILKHKFSSLWSSMLMLHGRRMKNEVDRNNDGFMDIPDNNSINIYNRWNYHNANKREAQINVKLLSDEIRGGQTADVKSTELYKTMVNTKRAELSGKLGFIYKDKPFKSIGNIFQLSVHDMKSSFGLKNYNATESSIYLQSIYQNILWQSNHQYKTGFTYRYNYLEQHFFGIPVKTEENIPGIFFEYTYNYLDKFTLISGVREDIHKNEKFVFIPRVHGKYNFSENFIVRFSGGKSYRIPYEIADHLSVLASSRQIIFKEKINPETAWNYGINFTKKFSIVSHELTFSADAYRTEFVNQLVVDSYTDSTKIFFNNLYGKSYSNSLQFTLNIELLEKLNLRLAYKFEDVRSTFNGKTEQQPLVSKNRALGTISYATSNEHWKFDYTLALEGKKKLQNVYFDSENNGKQFSPSFAIMNFQATKVFRKFELYGGAENIFDFRQLNPIIHPENPFGNSFDATNIWGPIQGRRIYAGIRLSIS